MDIVMCSLYYDSFPKFGLKNKLQYIALLSVLYYFTVYHIRTPVS